MKPRNVKNVISGALVGSLLGSLSALLISNDKFNRSEWVEKAKDIGERLYDGVKNWSEPEEDNSIFVKGAFLGLLLGAGSALLFTPKTGYQVRSNLIKGYRDIADKTQEIMDYVNHKQQSNKKRTLKKPVRKQYAVPKSKMRAKR